MIVVCTECGLVTFHGRVFYADKDDAADMRMLKSLKRDELPATRVVVLLKGEWENWIAHMHFFLIQPGVETRHFLLRLQWPSHFTIRA